MQLKKFFDVSTEQWLGNLVLVNIRECNRTISWTLSLTSLFNVYSCQVFLFLTCFFIIITSTFFFTSTVFRESKQTALSTDEILYSCAWQTYLACFNGFVRRLITWYYNITTRSPTKCASFGGKRRNCFPLIERSRAANGQVSSVLISTKIRPACVCSVDGCFRHVSTPLGLCIWIYCAFYDHHCLPTANISVSSTSTCEQDCLHGLWTLC